ncbi:hypothetical protein CCB81_08255 [Armatimonadetes bacterium Uphvl-Ar2]|nr:hypothetical protein CCB81_08255 [Armatimonadetes bacterium Uphvl-Ar2]
MTSKEGYAYAVEMWRPPQDARDMPVLIYNDGSGYAEYAKLPNQVQNLVAARQLPPVVLVLVTSPNRERDYWKEPDPYLAFVGARLLPWVRQTTGAVARREHTLMGGASLGGLISLRAGTRMPETFGMVHAQSPSLWAEPILAQAAGLKGRGWPLMGGPTRAFRRWAMRWCGTRMWCTGKTDLKGTPGRSGARRSPRHSEHYLAKPDSVTLSSLQLRLSSRRFQVY